MNNVPNKNSKVLEETVAGFNSYAAEKKLRGLRNFKMTLPLFQVLENVYSHSSVTLSHIIDSIKNGSVS